MFVICIIWDFIRIFYLNDPCSNVNKSYYGVKNCINLTKKKRGKTHTKLEFLNIK